MQNATAVPRDGGSGVPAVRNLDPRMKLLIVLVVGSAALFSPHRALLLWCYAIIAALWLLSGEARRALGFVAVLAAVALAEWGAGFIPNATVAGMVGFLFFIFARSLSTFALIMWMSVGLRIDDLIASLQRLRLPRGLVITIAVVFRYLPTAADEFRKISATMRLRGVELSARNLVLHPGRSLEYVLVPLIIRTIKIADDLAASAMTRGLDLVGARIAALRGVVLQQVSEHLRGSQIVDGNDLIALSAEHLAESETANAAETVNSNLNSHVKPS